jgi:hypothetical protein
MWPFDLGPGLFELSAVFAQTLGDQLFGGVLSAFRGAR